MWTPTTRAQHNRADLGYGSDVTDAEWLILSPFLPAPRRCGCPRKWEMREVVNAIFYVLRRGIAWSLLPKDLPPWPTAYRWFARPPSRTAMARGRCCGPRAQAGDSWHSAMPMAATPAPGSATPAQSVWRWCARPTIGSASPPTPGVGWSNASSPGSTATGGSPMTSRPASKAPRRSSTPLPACSCYEGLHVEYPIRNGV